MRFNLTYFGPENLFNLRRDYFLSLKYSLEDIGHSVDLSHLFLDPGSFNLIVGAYFLSTADLKRIGETGVHYAHINTEIIKNDCLNFNPQKTDFTGGYLPSMKKGRFVWDVVMDNLVEHERYGNRAFFQRWGWHPKLQDIAHKESKDLDFYFFGAMSQRRASAIQHLLDTGFRGSSDGSCPYFVRNDKIARAKVCLNIIQDDVYTHVNSFRVCYLATNRIAILSEQENDPAGYLEVCRIAKLEDFAGEIRQLIDTEGWKALAEESYETFKKRPMRELMQELLDKSFA